VLLRTWNLFHGNAVPPERRAFLEDMVRLLTADRPDLVLLQELPLWSFSHLEAWTGMQAFAERAAPVRLGPLPSTPSLGRRVTSLNHGLLRSAFSGQGNAILASAQFRSLARHSVVLNDRRFRRAQARWLRLGVVARLAWAKERRVCQTVRLLLPSERTLLVANLHATSFRPDDRLADAELLRAAVFVDGLADPGEAVVMGGDFNVKAERSGTLADLAAGEWGFDRFGHGVDHVLLRGARIVRAEAWPRARREVGGRLLSDHPPIEVEIEVESRFPRSPQYAGPVRRRSGASRR
jgi:endonuclease/exonuclease/phosphatase family metal-dependent hydrolase